MRTLRLPSLALVVLAAFSLQGCSTAQRVVQGSPGNVSAGQGRLEVVNNSARTLTSVEASSCSAANWGSNRLAVAVAPGARQSLALPAGCWDFRADFDAAEGSGNEVTQRNAQVPSNGSFTWTIGG